MPATTPTLTLPEPAGGLYRAVRESLDEFLPTVIDGGRGWWLGGGTVLAAQWGHRLSTDLDVFLPGGASLTPFDPRWSPDFRDAMLRSGATRLEARPRSIKAWFPGGRLEVTALDPVPPLPPRNVRIDGREALVLANAGNNRRRPRAFATGRFRGSPGRGHAPLGATGEDARPAWNSACVRRAREHPIGLRRQAEPVKGP